MKETFGVRLKRYRKALDINQTELGKAAGVGKAAVSSLETGRSKSCRPEHLFKFAKRLGVDPGMLATGQSYYSVPAHLAPFVDTLGKLPKNQQYAACMLIAAFGAVDTEALDAEELINLIPYEPTQ